MKRVAYISRSPMSERGIRVPIGMSDIVEVSRKCNPMAQITGMLSYRQSQYVQVLEGPYDVITDLMSKISADTRHEDVWVFIDETISERGFPNWGVSVFDFVEQGPFFTKFIDDNLKQINAFTEQQRRRLQPFIDVKETSVKTEKNYDGKSLRLLAWPDLNRVEQPQVIMGLCVKLTKKPYPFDWLVDSGEYGTHQQVTEIIKKFETLGILTIIEPEPEVLKQQVIPTKKPNKFYGAIKKFLGMG